MGIKLSSEAFEHAKKLVLRGKVVADERDAWSEHQPSAADENEFIRQHGVREYSLWYLGIDDSKPEDRKSRYKFPYGDFKHVHCCDLFSTESRAGLYNPAIEAAAAHLHGMIEARKLQVEVVHF